MKSAIVLLATFVVLGSFGCASGPERQWYKIGQHYTVAEFERDKAECTREKKLDFDCMRRKGWVDVSPDRPTPTPLPERAPTPRY